MRIRGYPILGLVLAALLCLPVAAGYSADALPPNSLVMTAAKSTVWSEGKTNIVQLRGPVMIEVDRARMSADGAVVWMTPYDSGTGQSVQIALIGKAEVKQEGMLRLDRELLIDPIHITGSIRLIGERVAGTDDHSDLFIEAADLRNRRSAASQPATEPTTGPSTEPTTSLATEPTTGPATGPTTGPTTATSTQPTTSATTGPAAAATTAPVTGSATAPTTEPDVVVLPPTTEPGLGGLTPVPDLQVPDNTAPTPPAAAGRPGTRRRAGAVSTRTGPAIAPPPGRITFDFHNMTRATTTDGNVAETFTNGFSLRYVDAQGNLIEFVSHDAVLFSNLKQLKGSGGGGAAAFQDHIVSGYFEGDVQVYMTPVLATKNELRMRAERVYYEFATDRAILTDVVFHTFDVQKNIPIFMRADKVRQMSIGEFKVDGVELTSSAFGTPTLGLYAGHAYVRAEDSGDPRLGERIIYNADNVIPNAFGLPLFYWPGAAGTMTARGSAFRNFGVVDNNQFGVGIRTEWGLLETLGVVPPKDVDASYRLDYMSKRGVGGGIDGKYEADTIDETTKQPLDDLGDFHAYFVDDRGVDVVGAARADVVPPNTFRGRAFLENQTYLTPDVEAQVRFGYISDSTFMAQYFQNEYNDGLPVDESIYLKYQKGDQVLSGLLEAQPNRAISTADEEQTNSEISRLPELGYYAVGDSVLNDHLTFFSEDTASALKFVRNTESLAQQGFYPGVEPGIPSYQYTGDPGDTTFRGDARQEVDYPINAGPFKVVPYAFGRYTGYSQGVVPPLREPQLRGLPGAVAVSSDQNRLMVGAGARVSTDFWRVDDSVESDLFDLHRLRHVVEPELNVFTSAQTVDQNRLFIYDQSVDAINDIQAVQLALHQRWQTKRGGPGRWRSTDFFTLNLYGNFFANQPANVYRTPTSFRGYFDYSQPEQSLARNSANADAQWRISDSTAILADYQENLDKVTLATASVGIAIQRDTRLSYFIGTRYIAALDSNIATIEFNYALDRKYTVQAIESVDLAQSRNVFYTFALSRNFDNFAAAIHVFYDQSSNNKGFSLSFTPFGLGRGVGSNQLVEPTP